ncbi:hypothetical protein HanRHA438_Chr07g0318401 [Helianthus annuus]|nr:hypothetical protein HanRHA438_Chr07g0318401 [Helianthus annuus]
MGRRIDNRKGGAVTLMKKLLKEHLFPICPLTINSECVSKLKEEMQSNSFEKTIRVSSDIVWTISNIFKFYVIQLIIGIKVFLFFSLYCYLFSK